MYRKVHAALFLLIGIAMGLSISDWVVLRAQPPGQSNVVHPNSSVPAASVQELLSRPYRFSFSRPTSLGQVALQLKQDLGIPVVLDIAAMERQNVQAEDTVRLELEGVRLKTGLKLLLDQVGMTYHVVAEDNLLIITDREGSDDPIDRLWNEMRTIHRELHDVQDAVDDLTDALSTDEPGDGARLRKPTIIEEKPEAGAPAPEAGSGEAKRKHGAETPAEPPHRSRSSRPRTSLRHQGWATGS